MIHVTVRARCFVPGRVITASPRRRLDANPGNEFAEDIRAQLNSEPKRHAADPREYWVGACSSWWSADKWVLNGQEKTSIGHCKIYFDCKALF